MAVIPTGKAPSIPTKKLAATAYTHKGFDKVGPAGYNPKVPTVKPQAPIHDFTKSKIQRKLFEYHEQAHNNQTWDKNPGPGVYDYTKLGQKQFNSTGENTTF